MKTQLTILSILLLSTSSYSQVSYLGVNGGTSTDFVGWDNSTAFDLKVSHDGAYNIDFWTNGTQRMTLLSGGNLGIGTTTPAYLLDVSGGDINLSTGQGLRINGTTVLSNAGTGNMFVGGGVAATGESNAFFGHQAGNANTSSGINNTFIGNRAGQSCNEQLAMNN